MRVALVGTVESSAVALRSLAQAPGATLVAVVTLAPELASRHSDFVDLGPAAARAGAELIRSGDGNEPSTVEALTALAPDYLIVVGWSRLVGPALRGAARRGAIGYHPAPLPRLRGRAAIPWTILLSEPITAGTLFWLDDGADTGAILWQSYFHVRPDETAASLYARHMQVLPGLLDEGLALLAGSEPPRQSQDETCATWATRRTAEDGRIDWREPAATLERLVRAVGRPYPGAFTTETSGERLVVWRCGGWTPGAAARTAAITGQVTAVRHAAFAVRCGDGVDLWIEEWERPDRPHEGPPKLHARLGMPR